MSGNCQNKSIRLASRDSILDWPNGMTLEPQYRCVECSHPVSSLFTAYSRDNVRLTQCVRHMEIYWAGTILTEWTEQLQEVCRQIC